jgi:choline dehydrogenase-like flavoprotein
LKLSGTGRPPIYEARSRNCRSTYQQSGTNMFVLQRIIMASQGRTPILSLVFCNNIICREVDVSIGGQLEPEAKHIIDAGVETGVSQLYSSPVQKAHCHQYQLNTDQNDGDPIGIGLGPATTRRGIRTTSASAFLNQHELPNLTIITDSQVTRILFNDDRAIGIETSTGQQSMRYYQCEACSLTKLTAYSTRW